MDVHEIRLLFKDLGEHVSLQEIKLVITKYDRDHSGDISFDEFIAMIAHIKALSMKHASLDAAESAAATSADAFANAVVDRCSAVAGILFASAFGI